MKPYNYLKFTNFTAILQTQNTVINLIKNNHNNIFKNMFFQKYVFCKTRIL